jgi:hypothetical protein
MLNRDNNGLQIFWGFVVDKNLPKYKKEKETDGTYSDTFTVVGGGVDWSRDENSVPTEGGWANSDSYTRKPWYHKFTQLFKNIKLKREPIKVPATEFFKNIKDSINSSTFDVDLYNKRVDGYLKTIEQVKLSGQTSLKETLQEKLAAVKYENILYATGDVTTITEEQVVTFVKKSEKGIRLDWIKNFNRVIPSLIIDKKVEMDKLGVFDNYVIMHYDPNKKSYKETKEEFEKRKDPILFGVIKDVNKLYYVGDWEDEFCNLTLTDFIDEFGQDGIDANNITVNT